MDEIEKKVVSQLFLLQDLKYKDFQCKLMPTVSPDAVIGVRTPELRKLAKEFAKLPEAMEFIGLLPHIYYEENNLHGFIIETIKDYDETVRRLDEFLPYVDNWATCDLMSPRVFNKHRPELFEKCKEWIASGKTYTVRFGIEMLMSHFLDESFKKEALELVSSVRSDEYYINMMSAWYFATALAKQYDTAVPYIENRRLDVWVHNKTIQKSIESYRITDEQKKYLRTLRIK